MKTLLSLALIAISACVVFAEEPNINFEGVYEYRTDAESLDYLSDILCFFPNSKTASRVVRKEATQRIAWFCFVPSNAAKAMLNVPPKREGHCGYRGAAKILVSNYTDYGGYQPDAAKLENVISVGKPEDIPCN